MGIETQIQLFDNAKIRVAWDDEKEKYFFSVVDVIGVLTESADGRTYWKVLKNRLLKEGNETVTNCNQLKLPASDGKMRLQCPTFGMDYCFSYESEDVQNRVLDFLAV